MTSQHELESLVSSKLSLRGLHRLGVPMDFVHNGHTVALNVAATIYRGCYIKVVDPLQPSAEFRPERGSFDWDAIAAAVRKVAERARGVLPAGEPGLMDAEATPAHIAALAVIGAHARPFVQPMSPRDALAQAAFHANALQHDCMQPLQFYPCPIAPPAVPEIEGKSGVPWTTTDATLNGFNRRPEAVSAKRRSSGQGSRA